MNPEAPKQNQEIAGANWNNLVENPNESWSEHVERAKQLTEQATAPAKRGINLEKSKMTYRDKEGNLVETNDAIHMFYSVFDRYPIQKSEVQGAMRESLENGKPLSVMNIGVAQGQEALGYIQMASDMVGEDSIDDALDLELVEYADQTTIAPNYHIGHISDSSVNYLRNLFDTPKAHFGTPFQEYAKDLKEKGEKRDVILFNNVIQHLDYSVPKEQMREDVKNLVDLVADGGMFCMSCNQYRNLAEVRELFDDTVKILEEEGLTGSSEEVSGAGQQAIFKKPKQESE